MAGRKALVGIITTAVALRVASALFQGDIIVPLPGVWDQISYDALAQRVLDGQGFTFAENWWPATRAGEPTAHWSYLYTLYLTGAYGLFGAHPLAARVFQALVAGVLQPLFAWRIGARIFGPRVGLVAAALTAVYTYFVYYAGTLMTETFYILAIMASVDLALTIVAARAGQTQSAIHRGPRLAPLLRYWLPLGIALGIAVLLRQVVLVLVPFLLVWLLWAIGRRPKAVEPPPLFDRRSALAGLLVTGVALMAIIGPLTLHNYQVFDRFVPLNTNAGYAFFWANHPIHGTDFISILPSGTYAALIPDELRDLDEAAMDQALLSMGLRSVIDDPWRYLRLSLSRVAAYFEFLPSQQSDPMSSLARSLGFGVALPFIAYGLALAGLGWRRYVAPGQGASVALLYGFVATYTLIHLLSWALIRYRLPIDAFLLVFAALAVVDVAKITRRFLWLDRWGSPARALTPQASDS